MLGKKLAIDLGSDRFRLMVRGDSSVMDEPALVVSGRRGAIGHAARVLSSEEMPAVQPLADGRVASEPALESMVAQLISRAVGRQRLFKPDVVVAIPAVMPGRDRRLLLDCLANCGTRTSYLLDAPMAAALGASIPFAGPHGQLVISVGASGADIALLALEGTIVARRHERGGASLARALMPLVSDLIGRDATADECEQLVRTVASATPDSDRSGAVGDAHDVAVSASDLRPAVGEYVSALALAARAVLDGAPTAVRAQSISVTLGGGGAQLDGIGPALAAALDLPVVVAADPAHAAVRGAALGADSLDVLKRNLMYIR